MLLVDYHEDMRKTVTLDESEAELIKPEMNRTEEPQPKVPFRIKPFDLGLRPGLNYDKVWQLFEEVDGPVIHDSH